MMSRSMQSKIFGKDFSFYFVHILHKFSPKCQNVLIHWTHWPNCWYRHATRTTTERTSQRMDRGWVWHKHVDVLVQSAHIKKPLRQLLTVARCSSHLQGPLETTMQTIHSRSFPHSPLYNLITKTSFCFHQQKWIRLLIPTQILPPDPYLTSNLLFIAKKNKKITKEFFNKNSIFLQNIMNKSIFIFKETKIYHFIQIKNYNTKHFLRLTIIAGFLFSQAVWSLLSERRI